MKVRIKFRKYGILRFIGHLDVMRYFQKAMRRADIPIAFTGGYSPHMIMSFAQPLGIGLTSDGEYMDIELTDSISSAKAVEDLNAVMTEGMEVVSFRQISDDKKSSGMTIVAAADYLVTLRGADTGAAFWQEKLGDFLAQPSILVMKKTKRSEKEMDTRPLIYEASITENGLFLKLAAGSADNLKPDLVMDTFYNWAGMSPEPLHFHRLDLFARTEDGFITLEDAGHNIQ
ncbi:MAG TPA: TIGR03936 family radical SAM-associated protein [Lachnoclostridium phocaeense]|uniref:TIGR03936 family radical SAM-associated protein n=1 Tax=Lachnoclostridium phocaeense TaxID=1871021 RepID=A0A921LDU6_9FIRM|nr:TIGR03936 family radical SAM-associated protein [Lachnoclostridium phocaeense]